MGNKTNKTKDAVFQNKVKGKLVVIVIILKYYQNLLEIPEKYGVCIDIMIEAKMKELSIQKLYEKRSILNVIV